MENNENPLLKKIRLPGKRFRLPSKGLFYHNGELDESVVDGEVEVFSMTTVDEITLRSPEFLYSGEAIERVFKRCVPEIKKPLKLLSRDVDYVLACLRVVSYGGIYQIDTYCPDCEEKQEQINEGRVKEFLEEVRVKAEEQEVAFDLAMLDEKVQNRLATLSNRRSTEHTYSIDLEGIMQNNTTEISKEEYTKYNITLTNGQEICMTPLRMDSAVAAHQFQNNDNTLDLTVIEEYVSFLIACTVLSVDGVTDWDNICEWAQALPLTFKREMEVKTKKFGSWGTDFTYVVKCKEEGCGHERNISTLLNPITFFMIPSESEEPSS